MPNESKPAVHTATPWRLHDMERFTVVAGRPGIAICLADAKSRTPEENDANTEHIIRSVNAHEALVEALRGLVGEVTEEGSHETGVPNDSPVTIRCQLGDIRRASQALALAEEEK